MSCFYTYLLHVWRMTGESRVLPAWTSWCRCQVDTSGAVAGTAETVRMAGRTPDRCTSAPNHAEDSPWAQHTSNHTSSVRHERHTNANDHIDHLWQLFQAHWFCWHQRSLLSAHLLTHYSTQTHAQFLFNGSSSLELFQLASGSPG